MVATDVQWTTLEHAGLRGRSLLLPIRLRPVLKSMIHRSDLCPSVNTVGITLCSAADLCNRTPLINCSSVQP